MLSQCRTAWARNPQGISKVVNQGYCFLSDSIFWMASQVLFALDLIQVGSLHFVQYDSVDLPC